MRGSLHFLQYFNVGLFALLRIASSCLVKYGINIFRKGCKALGNTLVTFTNENNGCLQINSWLGMRSLWHGSKIDMSLAPKRKLSVLGRKRDIKVGDREFAKRFG
ncbi:hypothetical protein ACE6H2_009520 [Prunus campanulata]